MARHPARYYRRFLVPKGRSGETREIASPRVSLKVIQAWFGHHLARHHRPAEHVHGFVPGRSTISAAAAHCPADWVVSVDVENFFGSVTVRQVHDALKQLRYPGPAAWLMAKLTTLNGVLAQGSPASPPLSNIAFSSADQALEDLSRELGLRISRYADDVAVSGEGSVPERVVGALESCVVKAGWKIARGKTRIMTKPGAVRVLGLNVCHATPRLPKHYRNRIRMMRHMLVRNEDSLRNPSRYRGHVAYARAVERTRG